MKKRVFFWGGLGGGGAALAIGGGVGPFPPPLATIGMAWVLSLPPSPDVGAAPPIAKEEADAMLAALRPPKRQRPLIAIVGINDATETTDYLMPYGILQRADVADVVALATKLGPVTLYPAFKVVPDMTVADFDTRHP